jgi:5-methylcytosine-specific restriction endonuclease McrA
VALTDVALRRVAGQNPSTRPDQLAEAARLLAKNAKDVHLLSLMWSVPALSDGKITPAGAEQICTIGSLTLSEFYDGADLLVDAGAWRRTRATKREPLGAYQMLLGWAPGEQPTREEDQTRRRKARLRDALREGGRDYPTKLAAIERADGQCEYCDATDPTQIDHVDPTRFSNALVNLAWVCARCNKRKGAIHDLAAVGMSFTTRAKRLRSRYATRIESAQLTARKPKTRRKAGTSSTRGPRVDTSVGTVSGRVGSGRVGSGQGAAGTPTSDTHADAGAPPPLTDADAPPDAESA